MKNKKGFTLIELVIFIVVMGIIAGGLLLGYSEILRHSHQSEAIMTATELAKKRMEIILGNRRTQGFASFVDPCVSAPPPYCSGLSGWTVTSSIASVSANQKSIVVQAQGLSNATLISRVSRYDP